MRGRGRKKGRGREEFRAGGSPTSSSSSGSSLRCRRRAGTPSDRTLIGGRRPWSRLTARRRKKVTADTAAHLRTVPCSEAQASVRLGSAVVARPPGTAAVAAGLASAASESRQSQPTGSESVRHRHPSPSPRASAATCQCVAMMTDRRTIPPSSPVRPRHHRHRLIDHVTVMMAWR